MAYQKTPKNSKKFCCEKCDFVCSNKQDYNRHLTTAKHKRLTNAYQMLTKKLQKNSTRFTCECGKVYNHKQSLYRHKKNCTMVQGEPENAIVTIENRTQDTNNRDELIERLVTSNTEMVTSNNEMKTMFQLLLEKYHESQLQNQQLMNKMIDVIPQIGSTTTTNNTTNNNTLNFYLTNTCKDAETIHDFTERFVQRSVDFFKGNFHEVAHNKVDLASNVYDIFKKCLDENPQTRKFVQTTDAKNGIVYIKEKPKDANRQLYGDAEFIKYMDGFERAGTNISHAINCAFLPIQSEVEEILEKECGKKPCEEDYEDEEQYEKDMDRYKEKTGDLKRHLLIQSLNTVCLFDAKKRRIEVLEKTRRLKE